MPVTLKIECGSLPPPEKLLKDLCERMEWPFVDCAQFYTATNEPATQARQWQPDFVYQIYIPLESTRGIELWIDNEHCFVKILPLCCMSDAALAIELSRELLQYGGGGIESDDGHSIKSVLELNGVYNQKWASDFILESLNGLFGQLTAQPMEVLTLAGPKRNFYFGYDTAQYLLKQDDGSDDFAWSMAEKLWSMMRRTQFFFDFPDRSGFKEGTVYALQTPGMEGKMAAYFPANQGILVPRADCLALDGAKRGELIVIPLDVFQKVCGDFMEASELEILDELQFALMPMKDARYTKLVQDLSNYGV
ncbi:MAG: hypothetical protein IPP57_24835 [Candidatus Obscuribacter sp.]|jgi:hypothetical protein|nr:hypothetical protein [Candidatus Obscuribacter sp.]MDQ5966192.1 hypothetical protein [Cyanobacteriota bacterium erpe_2018_sw_39hr_WHONDRS-SW48-000098_B_bin.30]MBK9203685.1 hypothetical protein [Candidatus Obscuribacter sp.]MBK9774006.1 hypothetical protein [Candidatus Obscuribacter sp.]MBL0185676.1 hypothetical protein [Candidatus Obscuribacter sp.]